MNILAELQQPGFLADAVSRDCASAATKGERDEFLSEIERHKNAFYRFVRRTLWDASEADDVFSEAILAAYENRHKYTPGTNFRAWMFRILQNKCFVANRETGRRSEPLENVENAVPARESVTFDVMKNPMDILDTCSDQIYRAFEQLPPAQRACIMLKSVEGLSYHEIADVLEIPFGTVVTHLSRGRAKLRRLLGAYACASETNARAAV